MVLSDKWSDEGDLEEIKKVKLFPSAAKIEWFPSFMCGMRWVLDSRICILKRFLGKRKSLSISCRKKKYSEHDWFLPFAWNQVLFGICSIVWMIICLLDLDLEHLNDEAFVSPNHPLSVCCGYLLNHDKCI